MPYVETFKEILDYNRYGSLRLYEYALEKHDKRLIMYHYRHNLGATRNTQVAIIYGLKNVLVNLIDNDFTYTHSDGTVVKSVYDINSVVNELITVKKYELAVYINNKYCPNKTNISTIISNINDLDKVVKYIEETKRYDVISSDIIIKAVRRCDYKSAIFLTENIPPKNINYALITYMDRNDYKGIAQILQKRKQQ